MSDNYEYLLCTDCRGSDSDNELDGRCPCGGIFRPEVEVWAACEDVEIGRLRAEVAELRRQLDASADLANAEPDRLRATIATLRAALESVISESRGNHTATSNIRDIARRALANTDPVDVWNLLSDGQRGLIYAGAECYKCKGVGHINKLYERVECDVCNGSTHNPTWLKHFPQLGDSE